MLQLFSNSDAVHGSAARMSCRSWNPSETATRVMESLYSPTLLQQRCNMATAKEYVSGVCPTCLSVPESERSETRTNTPSIAGTSRRLRDRRLMVTRRELGPSQRSPDIREPCVLQTLFEGRTKRPSKLNANQDLRYRIIAAVKLNIRKGCATASRAGLTTGS